MAEVRKKVMEDKYNTSSIKKSEEKKEKKIVDKSSVNKNTKKNEEKKSLFVRFRIFCSGVKSEFKKVHWTSKENMVKYSVASIVFILFCSGFFYLIDVVFALIRSLFN
ncbi:MAG: preprotein translocase subunit SecE [Bacilli bacterium]|nr:preprotein translocase subunit SecE [Bacilli bacterium]